MKPQREESRTQTPGVTNEPVPQKGNQRQDHYWQYCANCGMKLESRKCKLICPRCGFYHSCGEP